jgi:selenide,water dikinase
MIQLTGFSHGAGCGCKLGPDELAEVLRHLDGRGSVHDPDLLVGIAGSDDAGVYRLREDLALVQTVDFFTPIVDEAEDWGRIAAANALSDVYAMGGTPLTALQLVAWPRDDLPLDLLARVVDGGMEILEQAGCVLVGGHSIDDKEPKYGFAVTGLIHPDDVITNAGAAAGDMIVLSKPIGTGVIATAIKRGKATQEQRDAAVASMTALNAAAAAAARRIRVKGGTDVTGFGLLGHLTEMIRASGLSAEIDLDAVPMLPGVLDLIAEDMVAGGSRRNLAAVTRTTDFGDVDDAGRALLSDAQTSGGLLLAVSRPLHGALMQAIAEEGAEAWTIGRFTARAFSDGPSGMIRVR